MILRENLEFWHPNGGVVVEKSPNARRGEPPYERYEIAWLKDHQLLDVGDNHDGWQEGINIEVNLLQKHGGVFHKFPLPDPRGPDARGK